MTREDIIAMAKQAGFEYFNEFPEDYQSKLERFAKLVRDDYSNKHANLWLDRCHAYMQAEREACARVCEELETCSDAEFYGHEFAAAIRARGETSEMTLEEVVKKFFDYLNRTEESDSGRVFHPVTINCCRVMWMKDLEDTLTKMAELSGSELKKNERKN